MAEGREKDLSQRPPTPQEAEKAMEAARALARYAMGADALPLRVGRDVKHAPVVELPPAVAGRVLDLLALIGRGEAVTFFHGGAEHSTQQAADLLNVSRPFLIKLIQSGEIQCHKVGTHRRIKAADLIAYKQRRDAEREKALVEMARLGQQIEAE